MPSILSLMAGLLLFATLQFTPTTAHAAIYKCVDASGSVLYSQSPCPDSGQNSQFMAGNGKRSASAGSAGSAGTDCRIANNFAMKTAREMRNGMSSSDVFNQYGGIDAVSATTIGIVNYVYTHRQNYATVPQRIVALSAARCSGGSYGPVGCEQFPYGFTEAAGGCDAAASATGYLPAPRQQYAPQAAYPAGAAQGNMNASMYGNANQPLALHGQFQPTSAADCRQQLNAELEGLFASMRNGQSAAAQSNLQARRNQIRKQMAACGN